MTRLARLDGISAGVRLPGYDTARHRVGIVHLGPGAFHRAHQAVYTDDALAAGGGDWRILGVSPRGTEAADALGPQNGLYTLLERGEAGTSARVIGSIADVLAASRDRAAVLDALAAPGTRIVGLTVTEKAYGILRETGTADREHPAIAADLAASRAPSGVIGLLVEGLRRRREAGLAAYTVLCCDNLPDNGGLLRAGVTDFARRLDPALADWIEARATFPSTMVDRITPAATDATLADARALTGFEDHAAVETEPFTQWVIEDRFAAGRPAWEAGGALFATDVAPFERMKLRMLNGSHSLIAYAGFLAGHALVREAMAHAPLRRLVERHLAAAARTLGRMEGIDLDAYAAALAARFSNPAIAHQTWQIAMDGTEKLPQRLLAPAAETLAAGGDVASFAFAVAAWMRYCLGRRDDGEAHGLRDPRETEIAAALAGSGRSAPAISAALHALPGLFPERLSADAAWRMAVETRLAVMLEHGMAGAIEAEAAPVA